MMFPKNIRRRYYAGLRNLIKHYLPLCDGAHVLDNSNAKTDKVIAKKQIEGDLIIEEQSIWKQIQEFASAR